MAVGHVPTVYPELAQIFKPVCEWGNLRLIDALRLIDWRFDRTVKPPGETQICETAV
jgi:hypothetical protein